MSERLGFLGFLWSIITKVFTHFHIIVMVSALIVLFSPVVVEMTQGNFKEAAKEFMLQIALPDTKIKEGMEFRIENPDAPFKETFSAYLQIFEGMSSFIFLFSVCYKINTGSGGMVAFYVFVVTFLLLGLIEMVYLTYNDLGFWPYQGFWLVLTHLPTFLPPLEGLIRFFASFSGIDAS